MEESGLRPVEEYLLYCLNLAVTEGVSVDSYSWGETNKFSLSDFKRFGFIEADISKYLSNHGLALPVALS